MGKILDITSTFLDVLSKWLLKTLDLINQAFRFCLEWSWLDLGDLKTIEFNQYFFTGGGFSIQDLALVLLWLESELISVWWKLVFCDDQHTKKH